MEFKGTKGKWYKGIGTEIISMPNQIKVAKVSGSNYEEGSYNALLISKTPEMLKLHQSELKTLLNLQQTMYDREVSVSIIQEIERMILYKEQLIKQATEL